MPQPIFVVGKNRSGTKWLTNLIANHAQVSCVQSARHTGVLETNMLVQAPRIFGPLLHWENRVAFIETFAATDFFLETSLPKEFLYSVRAESHSAFFRQVMDAFAEARGTTAWAQKIPTLYLSRAQQEFPDARFIGIVRDAVANMRSEFGLRVRRDSKARFGVLSESYLHTLERKRLERAAASASLLLVRYEDLQADRETVLRGICESLGLSFSQSLLEDRWRQNTSFGPGGAPRDLIGARTLAAIRLAVPVMGAVPYSLLEALYSVRTRLGSPGFMSAGGRRFVQGSFAALGEKLEGRRPD
ncbi:MAG: sulfotransferase [Myxococcota bacterium]|nr:sulfotransferase [Myxococcota bacterium]